MVLVRLEPIPTTIYIRNTPKASFSSVKNVNHLVALGGVPEDPIYCSLHNVLGFILSGSWYPLEAHVTFIVPCEPILMSIHLVLSSIRTTNVKAAGGDTNMRNEEHLRTMLQSSINVDSVGPYMVRFS